MVVLASVSPNVGFDHILWIRAPVVRFGSTELHDDMILLLLLVASWNDACYGLLAYRNSMDDERKTL